VIRRGGRDSKRIIILQVSEGMREMVEWILHHICGVVQREISERRREVVNRMREVC
jgi:hypothetical protein